MSWLSALPTRGRVKAKPRAEYRLSEHVKDAIRADVREGERIARELQSYTAAAIAKRYGIHERSVSKIGKS